MGLGITDERGPTVRSQYTSASGHGSSWRQSGCYGLYLSVAFLELAFIPVFQILPTLAEYTVLSLIMGTQSSPGL